MQVLAPDADLLGRAVTKFLGTTADPTYDSLGGGFATQGPTVNYWFLLDGAPHA